MKKILLLITIVFVFSINYSFANSKIPKSDTTKIVLINPGVFYLKSLTYLTNNNYIKIDKLQYQAVFYSKSEVSYDKAKEYINENNIKNIKLFEIEGDLDRNNLYQENSCSKKFYEIFNNSDGVIFLGGWDIPPYLYNQKTKLLTGINTPNRHYFELSFLFHLLGGSQNQKHKAFLKEKPNYVVSGICLGMQSMNVATGGDMYQDIPSDIYNVMYVEDVLELDINKMHRNYWRNIDTDNLLGWHNFHKIKFTDNKLKSNFAKLKTEEQPMVCSSHHQAIKNIGKDFEIAASSIDGKVIEAISHKKYKNVFGVQFHPEFYYLYDPTSKKVKLKPTDTEIMTEHEMLKKFKSFDFHKKYWSFFSELF